MRRKRSAYNNWLKAALLTGALSIAIAALAPGLVVAADEKAVEIMRKSMAARNTVAYSATAAIVSRKPDGGTEQWSQVVYRDAGDRERVKILDHEGTLVWLRVCDGSTRYEHNLRHGSLRKSTPSDPDYRRKRDELSLTILKGNFDLAVEGADVVAGRNTHRISICKRGEPTTMLRRLWVDQQNYLELKTEVYDAQGRPTHSVTIQRIRVNPQFAPSTFQYKLPEAVEPGEVRPPLYTGTLARAAAKAGLKPLPPPELPRGFALLDGIVAVREFKGHRVLWYQHTDGLRWFSVFQRPHAPGDEPKEASTRRFRAGPFQITVVGSLSEEELKLIRAGYQQQH